MTVLRPLDRFTLARTMGEVARFIPAALVSAPARAAVMRAAARLPAALTRAVYLECRLAPGEAPVDLIVRVEADGGAILAGRGAASLASEVARGPVWERVARLCRWWVEGGSPLAAAVGHLWLEFDLADATEGEPLPQPSLFVSLRARAVARLGGDDWGALLDVVGNTLLPGGLDGETRRRARAVIGARPAGTSIPYLGVMSARASGAVRVYVRGPAAAEVAPFLRRQGWSAAAAELAPVLDEAGALRDAPPVGMLHVDVAGGPLPRVGVELAFARPPQLRGALVEGPLLEWLVAGGLSTAARAEALATWPGTRFCTLPHELWRSVMSRRVNCVKLVAGAGALEAKAYLLAFHLPAGPPRHG